MRSEADRCIPALALRQNTDRWKHLPCSSLSMSIVLRLSRRRDMKEFKLVPILIGLRRSHSSDAKVVLLTFY